MAQSISGLVGKYVGLSGDALTVTNQLPPSRPLQELLTNTPQPQLLLPLAKICRIFAQVQRHHGALRPNLLYVDDNQQVYIEGWREESSTPEEHGKIEVTEFSSPEEARKETSAIGIKSDVFSLGVILYQVLTGQKPFHGETSLALLREILACKPKPPSEISPECSSAVSAFCLRVLSRDPQERPSFEEIATALESTRATLLPCPQCGKELPVGTSVCPDDGALLQKTLKLSEDAPSSNKPPEDAKPDLHKGLQIGEYILEQRIGQGGMGEVWSGQHPKIGKRVAIKFLGDRLSKSQKTLTRFINEAKAVNEIQHRNIVDIFSFGELSDGRPYFVMEYLRGRSLADYLRERGPLPFSEILVILEQCCRALQAAHEKGIIHRDLKPDNIFLVLEDGAAPFVKVLDFGIAKLSGDSRPDGKSLTATGAVMGTVAYMSPEQCEGAKAVENQSDIYSLGIVLFEMITGRTPFCEPNDGLGAVITKHMTAPLPALTTMVAGRAVSAKIEAFLQRALAKDSRARPQSIRDFYSELVVAVGSYKNEVASSVIGAKPLFASGEHLLQKPKSSRVGVALVAVAVLAAGLVIFLFAGGPRDVPVKNLPQSIANKEPATKSLPTTKPAAALASAPATKSAQEMVTLMIVVAEPTGVTLTIEGEAKPRAELGKDPFPLAVVKSNHKMTLLFSKEGYDPVSKTVIPFIPSQVDVTLKKSKKLIAPTTKKLGDGVGEPPPN